MAKTQKAKILLVGHDRKVPEWQTLIHELEGFARLVFTRNDKEARTHIKSAALIVTPDSKIMFLKKIKRSMFAGEVIVANKYSAQIGDQIYRYFGRLRA